jgi:hypothetical protein
VGFGVHRLMLTGEVQTGIELPPPETLNTKLGPTHAQELSLRSGYESRASYESPVLLCSPPDLDRGSTHGLHFRPSAEHTRTRRGA